MRFRDVVFLIISNLRRMKLRLALTSLGVVIGTSAIVLMVSLGIGLQNNITNSLGDLGDATHITVWGGGGMGGEEVLLDQDTLDRFATIEHVEAVLPSVPVYAFGELQYKRYTAGTMAMGAPMDVFERFDYQLSEGRLPRSDDEIIVGAKIPQSFAKVSRDGMGESVDELDLLNKRVIAKGYEYSDKMLADGTPQESKEVEWRLTVVGVLEPNAMTDQMVYLPLEAALDMNDQRLRDVVYDQVVIKADSVESVAAIEQAVTADGFYPMSAHTVQSQIKKTFAVVQAVLGALGAIAMLVAAIGITNTMTMSIYERTREIGIMKAVGASNRQIKRVFLGEAAVIGVLGGLGGLIFSASGAALANLGVQSYIASSMSMNGGNPAAQGDFFSIPLWLAVFAVAFAAGIGLLSGMLPAVRAANLDPLIALRHE